MRRPLARIPLVKVIGDPCATRSKAELTQLRRECAWCGQPLAEGREPTSHGICQDCARRAFPAEKGGQP
jgi:hypothetical protein